jgi:glycosyltransferase involved in cell wall biosynthesis
VKEMGLKNQIFPQHKTIVIHKGSSNGVNLSLFNPNETSYRHVKETLQEKYQLKDAFVFGFLGRIVDRKGINELFEVFCELYQANNKLRLLLVGPFEMSQIADKNLVEKINQHPGIINYGKVKQEEVPGFMLTMNVFVLPAWWEGFGNVLVQAAAMGVPVISTTGTGTIDAVSDGYNGILVPVKNKLKLKEAMIKLMSDDKMRQSYSAKGLEWSMNFDREIIWQELHKIYQS